MNLQHFQTNNNKPFTKSFFYGLDCHPEYLKFSTLTAAEGQDEYFGDSDGSINPNTDISKADQKPETNSLENKLIELYDRVGRSQFHDFTGGNICVFGDKEEEVENFTTQLLSRIEGIKLLKGGVDACNISLKLFKNPDTQLLIKVSGPIAPRLMNRIINASHTICILPLSGSKITCGLASKVSLSRLGKELINSLGGNRHLRELLIASLVKGEFLLIENTTFDKQGSQAVRCFQTILKQPENQTEPAITIQ